MDSKTWGITHSLQEQDYFFHRNKEKLITLAYLLAESFLTANSLKYKTLCNRKLESKCDQVLTNFHN